MRPSSWTSRLLAAPLLSAVLWAVPPAHVQPGLAQSLPITGAIPDDPAMDAYLAPYAAKIKASFGQPLIKAPQGLFRGRRGEENLLGYWVADTMRAAAAKATGDPIPFAITNAGGLRANLRAGMLKVEDIYDVMPFENEVVIIQLTGSQIIQVVREGLLHEGGEPCSGVCAKLSGTPARTAFHVAWADGKPIDPAATYRVATTDYLYEGGGRMRTLSRGRGLIRTGLTLRQVLLDRCTELAKAGHPLLPPAPGRYVIPPALQEALRERQLHF